MIIIKDLLAKFTKLISSEKAKKEAIRAAISETIGAPINSEDISLKESTVYLNIKPIYKSEIFLKKQKILSLLNESLGKEGPLDIR